MHEWSHTYGSRFRHFGQNNHKLRYISGFEQCRWDCWNTWTRSIHRLVLRSEKKYWKWLASWQYKANTEQIRRKLLTSFLIHCRSRQILSVASSGTWTRTFVTSDAVKHGRGNAYCTFDLSSMCDARSPFLHKSKNTLMPMPLPLIGIYTAHAGIEIFYWFYFVYNSLYIILKVIYLKISIHGGTAL